MLLSQSTATTQIFISSYGWICLNPEYRNYRDLPYMLDELPNETISNPTLCVQCPNPNQGDGGEIMFWTDGETMAVITFQDMVWRYMRNITKTFQVIMSVDGWVKYQYTEQDGNDLTFDWERNGLPEAAQFTDNGDGSASFCWQTERGDAGNYSPVFTVSDGVLEGELEIVIAVGESPVDEFVVELIPRWSMISCPIPPENLDMQVIFGVIVERNNLELAKDHLGNFYAPVFGYNGIGNWDVHFGYLAKVIEPDELIFKGEFMPEEEAISLRLGWSIVAYYPEAMVPAPQAFANLGDLLIIAKDGAGHFYVVEWGYSDMGSLCRGQGYLVKTSEETELVWNVPDQVAMIGEDNDRSVISTPVHYGVPQMTDRNMSLLLLGDKDLVDCEVAAVSTDGIVVGTGIFDRDSRAGLGLWGDDPTTEPVDGLREGESFTLRMWDCEDVCECDLRVDGILSGWGMTYRTDEFAAFDVSVAPPVPDVYYLSAVFPNPFNSLTTLTFGLPVSGNASVLVHDINGRLAARLIDGELSAGHHSVFWDGSGFSSGIYLVQMHSGSFHAVRKVILLR